VSVVTRGALVGLVVAGLAGCGGRGEPVEVRDAAAKEPPAASTMRARAVGDSMLDCDLDVRVSPSETTAAAIGVDGAFITAALAGGRDATRRLELDGTLRAPVAVGGDAAKAFALAGDARRLVALRMSDDRAWEAVDLDPKTGAPLDRPVAHWVKDRGTLCGDRLLVLGDGGDVVREVGRDAALATLPSSRVWPMNAAFDVVCGDTADLALSNVVREEGGKERVTTFGAALDHGGGARAAKPLFDDGGWTERAVARDDDGGFVFFSRPRDGSNWRTQRFDAKADARAAPRDLARDGIFARELRAARLPGGGWVVTYWAGDGPHDHAWLQRFDARVELIGGAVPIDSGDDAGDPFPAEIAVTRGALAIVYTTRPPIRGGPEPAHAGPHLALVRCKRR
jgi:hypothetical protein